VSLTGIGQGGLALVAEELCKGPTMLGPLPGDLPAGSPEPGD